MINDQTTSRMDLGTALALTGCQQKSVIDKCVEAQASAICNKFIESEPNKHVLFYKAAEMSESQCIEKSIKVNGGDWQLECLKAQTGKH